MAEVLYGCEVPRLWTRPLRPLTPETSHGFHVIDFAAEWLGIKLYPWQRWLLIHALELNEDGTYRFRKLTVIVGRQNGKTLLLTVLALWWLFVDSESFPEHVPAHEFLVLGTAQNLDIAEEAWDESLKRCDPTPDPDVAMHAVPVLQQQTRAPVKVNGKKSLRLRSGARYEPRAASRAAGRGKTAARIIMDEVREQHTWDVWGSVGKTKNAVFNSQLWAISSAGDARSVVLAKLRTDALAAIEWWLEYVETGLATLEQFANEHDVASGHFEWSAPDGTPKDHVPSILQSNPSVGHRPMMLATILSDAKTDPDAVFRTEVLGQWLTAAVVAALDADGWGECLDPESEPAEDARLVLGVDVSQDRKWTSVGVAGLRDDGLVHVELIAHRAGMVWAVPHIVAVAERQGIHEVALQVRGCPAGELAPLLVEAGLAVIEINGSALGASTGQAVDAVDAVRWRHRGQPALSLSVSGATTKPLGEVRVWDRAGSAQDAAPTVAIANAAYALGLAPATKQFRSAYEDEGLLVV